MTKLFSAFINGYYFSFSIHLIDDSIIFDSIYVVFLIIASLPKLLKWKIIIFNYIHIQVCLQWQLLCQTITKNLCCNNMPSDVFIEIWEEKGLGIPIDFIKVRFHMETWKNSNIG